MTATERAERFAEAWGLRAGAGEALARLLSEHGADLLSQVESSVRWAAEHFEETVAEDIVCAVDVALDDVRARA